MEYCFFSNNRSTKAKYKNDFYNIIHLNELNLIYYIYKVLSKSKSFFEKLNKKQYNN